MKKYVITGGPCSGKTTIIYGISSRGFPILQETARKVMWKYGIHPKDDFINFQKVLMDEQIKIEKGLEKCNFKEVFLDRSLIDTYAYAKFGGLKYPEEIIKIVENAKYDKIFFLERLDEYMLDPKRWESEEIADELHKTLYKTYIDFGYEPIYVPSLPFKERIDFILSEI